MRYSHQQNKIIEEHKGGDNIAVVGVDKTLAWKELCSIAQKVGERVDQLKTPEGHPVIVYGHKEAAFPAIILGLMLKNIPYIPIDKIYPDERINNIILLSGAQVLFNCSTKKINVDIAVFVDADFTITYRTPPEYTVVLGSKEDPVRYIKFTSGSTGEPKGVQITHNALCSFVDWVKEDFGFNDQDVFMNQVSFSFDVSLYEICMFLHYGATIVLNDSELANDRSLWIERLKDYKQSVWVSTPSFAHLFLREEKFHQHYLPHIKTFVFCGETLPVQTAQKLLQLFPDARVLNTYGPTEATVSVTLVEITQDTINKHPLTLPVGYPKKNTELLIMNTEKKSDEPGDVVIVGDNVSIGYLKRPDLNQTFFYLHNGKRAYITGDQGYLKDGMLFFLGRNDDQVKLHGYRIELDEISACIAKHAKVQAAVTLPLKRGNETVRIISYVVPIPTEKEITQEAVIAFIKVILPYYMIPSEIKFIDEIPYNRNFKVDKKKLMELYMRGL